MQEVNTSILSRTVVPSALALAKKRKTRAVSLPVPPVAEDSEEGEEGDSSAEGGSSTQYSYLM